MSQHTKGCIHISVTTIYYSIFAVVRISCTMFECNVDIMSLLKMFRIKH